MQYKGCSSIISRTKYEILRSVCCIPLERTFQFIILLYFRIVLPLFKDYFFPNFA